MVNNLLIKVCGMSRPDNIRAVAQLPVDMIGFIFCPSSKRYVAMSSSLTGLLPDNADPELSGFGAGVTGRHIDKVGVFADDTVQNILTHTVNFRLDAVQLHGSESPTFIRNLKSTIVPDIRRRLKIIKAISISSADDISRSAQYEGLVDLFVFDTKCDGYGGSGRQFDWSLLDLYKGDTPFLLSGGIGEDSIDSIRALRHRRFAGVDLNSRFETEPGVKDVERLGSFISRLG